MGSVRLAARIEALVGGERSSVPFMTALYTFRLVFLVFFGEARTHVHHKPGLRMLLPLGVLAVLSDRGRLRGDPGDARRKADVLEFPRAVVRIDAAESHGVRS